MGKKRHHASSTYLESVYVKAVTKKTPEEASSEPQNSHALNFVRDFLCCSTSLSQF